MIAAGAAALLLAATPFGELPFQPVPSAARCLQPTGAPGELVRWVPGGVEVLEARRDGLRGVGGVPLGRLRQCPAVAASAGAAAVLAGTTATGLRVALREPRGGWEAPVSLPVAFANDIDAAVSPRGDVVLAWVEYGTRGARVRAVRRPAGGGFGAIEEIVPRRVVDDQVAVRAGMTADGEALVAATVPTSLEAAEVRVTSGRPGGPLAAAITLARTRDSPPAALAVAADGRALVAVSGFNDLSVYERAPGAAGFGPPRSVFDGAMSESPAIALRDDGAAVLAWTQGPRDPLLAVMRDGPGPFGGLLRTASPSRSHGRGVVGTGFAESAGPPPEPDPRMRALLGADGRALVVWPVAEDGLATATLTAGGAGQATLLGSPLRDQAGLSPVVLADGARAVAWSDEHGPLLPGPRDGRLHLAVEGMGSPAAPAPEVTVGAPHRRALRPAQALVLPVRCSAACDLRVVVPGQPSIADLTGSLDRAGRLDLRIRPLFRPLAAASGITRIDLRSGAPGARVVERQTLRLRLRRLPRSPFPHIERLRAKRAGDEIEVRWTTDIAARDVDFYASGTRRRSRLDEPLAFGRAPGQDRRSFRVVLEDAARGRSG